MLAAMLMTALMAPQSPSGVVINELNYDDAPGADIYEFVEIYNGSSVGVDVSGWTLNGVDGSTSGNGTYTFPPGTVLPPGGFWVIGQAGVPNVNDSLGSLAMENGPDGIWLEDTNFVVQDGVVWEFALWTNPVPAWLEGDGLGGDIQLHKHASGNFNSISRAIDGLDTDDNGCDFRSAPWTPGTFNVTGQTVALPYVNNFDDPVASVVEPAFTFSFVPGNTQDPGAVQVAIISGIPQPTVAFPASPQGGNIAVWHDSTGGGNANWLSNFSRSDYLMEAYVYFTGANPNMTAVDGEHWVMGVRGHSDSFGEPANVGSYYSTISCAVSGTIESGHTGIAWVCNRTAAACELFLVDYNNGPGQTPGGDFIVLAGPIAVQSGVNDGWQRLRLCVNGTSVVANFGGTYGCDDGQRFTASTNTVCANGAYLTYRECIADNNNMLPLMTDALVVTECPVASANAIGTGSPTSQGIPTISASGLPLIGDVGFSFDAGNLTGSLFAGIILDVGAPLPGLPIPGAPATALLYAAPAVINAVVLPGSTASFPLPLPCVSSLAGLTVVGQVFAWDVVLPDALPIGLSNGLVLTLGF